MKKKSEIKIIYEHQLGGSDCIPLAKRAVLELGDTGAYKNELFIAWDQRAIIAKEGNDIVGILVYQNTHWMRQYNVIIGYVVPEKRRMGIYTKLWNKLKKIARENDVKWIVGATSPENTAMLEAMKAQGRTPFRIMFEYKVR